MLVLFLFTLGASAQDQTTGLKVTVVEKKWRMEVRNPALEKDPVKAMQDRETEERRRKDADRTNEILTEQGMPTTPPAVGASTPERGGRGISVTYVYELKISNTGDKTIRALTWEYVFFEPGTERELGRRWFESKVSISPGKTKNIVMRSRLPPTSTIDATKAGKKPRDRYSEQIVILSIEYVDGTGWQLTSN
jgi:hypothetical protein